MKLKKILIGLGILSTALVLSSCGSEEGSYEVKNINVYREKDKVAETIDIRFYKDNPSIPYIGVSDYYNKFFSIKLKLEQDNQYFKYTNSNAILAFDTKKEILSLNDISSLLSGDDDNKLLSPIIDKSTKTNKSHIKTIDLNNYEILTYKGRNDAYVPLTLLSNITGGVGGLDVAYNGKDIFVIDSYGIMGDTEKPVEYFGNLYTDGFKNDVKRNKDMIKYSYNQLCFTFDNLRGMTTQLAFKDSNLIGIGVDGILEHYYPEIKKLLLSESMSDYKKGLMYLFSGFNDGGHTILNGKEFIDEKFLTNLIEDENAPLLFSMYILSLKGKGDYDDAIKAAKKKAFGVDEDTKFYYIKDTKNNTKTAYIAFDSFRIDNKLWDEYYKGKTEVLKELEEKDTYAFVRKSLLQAKEDGMELVVFDFTSNEGGDLQALECILGLVSESKATIYQTDYVNNVRDTSTYFIDTNLDGKYDDKDVEFTKNYGFRIALLTSSSAYSSGNYLPVLMKELGYPSIGEKTSGGSCAICYDSTAEGITYSRSSNVFLTDSNGNNVDTGANVNFRINPKTENGYDFSKYFDFKTIYNYLNE